MRGSICVWFGHVPGEKNVAAVRPVENTPNQLNSSHWPTKEHRQKYTYMTTLRVIRRLLGGGPMVISW